MSNPFATPDIIGATATVPLIKGEVRFKINSVKSFLRTDEDGNNKNWGLRLSLTVKTAFSEEMEKFVGKNIPIELYLHNEGSLGMTKQFLLAANGYDPRDISAEEEFNNSWADDPEAFAFNPIEEPPVIGRAYQQLVGQIIDASGDPQLQDNGERRNQFRWRNPAS